jgi:dihydroflavonol-4-reductase
VARRVFVTGGSGFLGTALVRALVARGDEVRALARSDAAAGVLRELGAEPAGGDLRDEGALAAGMRGCELAFHVAGVNVLCPTDRAALFAANVEGARAAVRAAARAGVGRLVHTSSAATLGEAHGTVGREDSPHRGWYLSAYEQSKTEGERAALEVARAEGVDLVCVNPSSVQGPGRTRGTGRILLALLDGRLKLFIDTRISLVDIGDCVAGHLLAAERGVAGERYVLNGMTLTSREAFDLLERVGDLPARPRIVPGAAARVAGAAVEGAFRVAGRRPPLCREMVRTMLHGHAYDGSRAERELGLRYTAPEETLGATVAWARETGLLRQHGALP